MIPVYRKEKCSCAPLWGSTHLLPNKAAYNDISSFWPLIFLGGICVYYSLQSEDCMDCSWEEECSGRRSSPHIEEEPAAIGLKISVFYP